MLCGAQWPVAEKACRGVCNPDFLDIILPSSPQGGERWGVAKLVKAPDFDSGMRRFESFLLSHRIAGSCQKQLPILFVACL